MFFDTVILDLDNTLYDYDNCHDYALQETFLKINEIFGIDICLLKNVFIQIKKGIDIELSGTASSHNRFIYFKLLLEHFNKDFNELQTLHKFYWDKYFEVIKLNDGVYDFLVFLKSNNIKIYILTDFLINEQFQKLDKLNILNFIDNVITSEEIGIEKPSEKSFSYCLKKTGSLPNKTIMIGDNFKKDILGAKKIGVHGFWFYKEHDKVSIKKEFSTFNNFSDLVVFLKSIKEDVLNLVSMSKFVGERFDLTQAAGGNISIKNENLMLIKSSGISMANINNSYGYSIVDNEKMSVDIKNNVYSELEEYKIFGEKPSMETFFHSCLKKYTLHIHPIQINNILVRNNSKKIISDLFQDSLIIDYYTPGIDLCKEIKDKYKNQNIIFLLNHGVVFTSDDYFEIYSLLEKTIKKCELFIKKNFDKYRNVNRVSGIINKVSGCENIAYLSEDVVLSNYLLNKNNLSDENAVFPDELIYCGFHCIFMEGIEENKVSDYYNKYKECPKIIILDGHIYVVAETINKCREIESVFKAKVLIVDSGEELNYLSNEELIKINNLDSEKFRKSLMQN